MKHGELRKRIIGRLESGPATASELVEAAYGDEEDGGPLMAEQCIRITIHHMQRQGIRIEHVPGTYKLVK